MHIFSVFLIAVSLALAPSFARAGIEDPIDMETINSIDGVKPYYMGGFPDSAFKLKSYEELMQLPENAQLAYLENLRELVIDLENLHRVEPLSTQKSRDLNAYLLFLSGAIEEAHGLTQAQIAEAKPNRSNGKCPGGLNTASLTGGLACYRRTFTTKGCDAGFVAIHQQSGGAFQCMTRASYNALPLYSRVALRKIHPSAKTKAATQAFFKGGPNLPGTKKPVVATSKKPVAKKPATSVASLAASDKKLREEAAGAVASTNADEEPIAVRPAPTMANDAADANDAVATLDVAVDPNDAKVDLERVQPDHAFEDASPTEARLKECIGVRPETKCSDNSREEAKRKLYGSTEAMCLYAGNFSYWRNSKPSPGSCVAQNEFCFGQPSCLDEKGSRTKKHADLSCPSNQVICNPYIFSTKPDGSAICVAKSGNATDQCAAKTQYRDKEGKIRPIVDRRNNHFLFAHFDKHPGQQDRLAQGYNALKRQFDKICFSGESLRAYFCTECNLIRRRMLWANAEALNKDCSAFTFLSIDRDGIKKTPELKPGPAPLITLPQGVAN